MRFLSLIGIMIIVLLIMISPVFADESVLVNGTFYYRNITPQNDIYEKIVKPGDTIVLGRTYDLTYVLGSSKEYAWWRDESIEGTTCDPDVLISVSYIKTNGQIRPDNVTLDPAVGWKTGHWWQWDGCYQLPYQRNQEEPKYSPYIQDNNLMFTIINDPHPPTPTPIYVSAVPTPTPQPTATAMRTTPAPAPVNDDSWPWWYYPIGIVGGLVIFRILW